MSQGTAAVFQAARLEQVFDHSFASRWRTALVGGANEPFYQPATAKSELHLLHYRSDYFASALHEVAHWCIAGDRRRQLPDFGYWYAPEGRNPDQQCAFESAEAKPQALEWLFSKACGYSFCISVDNLGAAGGVHDSGPFRRQVLAQAMTWQQAGMPHRAQLFFDALTLEFDTGIQAGELELTATGLAG